MCDTATGEGGSGLGTRKWDKSSPTTSVIFRMGSPWITFCTSSMSSVSCSISARASLYTRALARGSEAKTRGNALDAILPASIGEVKRLWLGRLEAILCEELNHKRDDHRTSVDETHLRTSPSTSSRLLADRSSSLSLRNTGPIFSEYPQYCMTSQSVISSL
jgi:hypothetical protein